MLLFAFLSALHHKREQNAIKQCLIYDVCVTFAIWKLPKWKKKTYQLVMLILYLGSDFSPVSLHLQTAGCGINKLGSLTPPSSPKTASKSGHRRILSDVTHSALFGIPVSKSTQLLQAAAAEASLNKSKWAELLLFSHLNKSFSLHSVSREDYYYY